MYIAPDDASVEGLDAVFLALPHTASAPMAVQALDAGAKVIDLSADLRMDTPESYQKWYKVPHIPKSDITYFTACSMNMVSRRILSSLLQ